MAVILNRSACFLLALLASVLLAAFEVRAASSAVGLRADVPGTLSLPASCPAGEQMWTSSYASGEPEEAMDDTEDPADPQMTEALPTSSVRSGCVESCQASRARHLNAVAPPSQLRAPVLRRRIFKKP